MAASARERASESAMRATNAPLPPLLLAQLLYHSGDVAAAAATVSAAAAATALPLAQLLHL